ncbi:MAG: hypothetical protein OXC11_16125 [Rhodospirillales bacterium]|nr:hypothetical protein [Rhodospirillales bacterium]
MRNSMIAGISFVALALVGFSHGAAADSHAPTVAAPPQFGVGTVVVGDLTVNGTTQRITSNMIEKFELDGRTVDHYDVSPPVPNPGHPCDGETHTYWDAATHNWIGCLAGGKILGQNRPYGGRYMWPMEVGKEWRWDAGWVDNVLHPEWGGTYWADYKVAAYEEVTVPAGTFMAFRVMQYRAEFDTWRETNWFAPELGLTVKSAWKRSRNDGYGPVDGGWELVSFEPK